MEDIIVSKRSDVDSFRSKIDLLMNHFIDIAVQGYGWIAAA